MRDLGAIKKWLSPKMNEDTEFMKQFPKDDDDNIKCYLSLDEYVRPPLLSQRET